MEGLKSKLGERTVVQLQELASSLGVDLAGAGKKADIIERILEGADRSGLEAALNGERSRTPPTDEELDTMGEELTDIGRDVEDAVHKVEKMPSAENADIAEIDELLDNGTHLKLDYAELGRRLDTGRVKFQDGRYIESLKELAGTRETYGKFMKDVEDSLYAHIIISAENIHEDCKDSKCNNVEARQILLDAKRAFREGGARRREAADKLIEITEKIHREQVEHVRTKMAELERSVNAMKMQGVDVFNSERYIHRAKEAFGNMEMSQTVEYLEKAGSMAEESREEWKRRIEENIPRVEQIIQMADDLGADVSEAQKFLKQATVALENEDYALCSELAKVSERKAMESQQSQIQKAAQLERRQLAEAQEILSSIEASIQEAHLYNMPIQNIDSVLQNARAALQSNDYVNAKIYARDAEGLVRNLMPQIEAERKRILDTSTDLKVCTSCGYQSVKDFQNGWARCLSCGNTFQTKQKPEKKLFGLFNK